MIDTRLRNKDIRNQLLYKYFEKDFVIDKSGVRLVELLGVNFVADEDTIFGRPDNNYIEKEFEWYMTKQRNVNAMKTPIPRIWKQIATPTGEIQSNYGWCVFSDENHSQFNHVVNSLKEHRDSRRAIMIYTRPSIQLEFDRDGMSDFICTNSVQYLIRENKLHAIVNMRSNDAWAGFRNDYAWQDYVLNALFTELAAEAYPSLEVGDIIWQAGSLHLYEPQFYLLDYYGKCGKYRVTRDEALGKVA